jgi:hypothetical protein
LSWQQQHGVGFAEEFSVFGAQVSQPVHCTFQTPSLKIFSFKLIRHVQKFFGIQLVQIFFMPRLTDLRAVFGANKTFSKNQQTILGVGITDFAFHFSALNSG